MSDDVRSAEEASDRLAKRIMPLLAGHLPEVQGAALAQLLALWIAGFASNNPATQQDARDEVMNQAFDLVRALVPTMHETLYRRPR